MYEYVVVERPLQSTAQHTAITPTQKAANRVRADQSQYQRKYVRTYMHAASGLFPWSMEPLASEHRLVGSSTTYVIPPHSSL